LPDLYGGCEACREGGHVIRLTKKDIFALLFVYISVYMDEEKHNKLELVTKLSECMVNDPEKLPLPT
jgi:hypothetical protein